MTNTDPMKLRVVRVDPGKDPRRHPDPEQPARIPTGRRREPGEVRDDPNASAQPRTVVGLLKSTMTAHGSGSGPTGTSLPAPSARPFLAVGVYGSQEVDLTDAEVGRGARVRDLAEDRLDGPLSPEPGTVPGRLIRDTVLDGWRLGDRQPPKEATT